MIMHYLEQALWKKINYKKSPKTKGLRAIEYNGK